MKIITEWRERNMGMTARIGIYLRALVRRWSIRIRQDSVELARHHYPDTYHGMTDAEVERSIYGNSLNENMD